MGKWPNIFAKVATLEPSIYAGLRDFCPLSHFFFKLLKFFKNISNTNKIKKIKRIANKSGFLTKTLKGGKKIMNCQSVALLAGKYPTETLYRYVLEHNPDVKPERVRNFIALNQSDILITYNNGERELFDTLEGTRRYILYETDALTEEQHRKEFPRILRKRMRMRGMTQNDLAEKLNISQSMVSWYLTGRALPGYVILKNMAEVLNCSVEDLYLNF